MSTLPAEPPLPDRTEEFTPLDRMFGDFVCRVSGGNETLRRLGMEIVRARRAGHSFLRPTPDEIAVLQAHPELLDDRTGLLALDDGKLYLYREFRNETTTAEAVAARLRQPLHPAAYTDEEMDRAGNFPLNAEQRNAVRNALARDFAVITGGPGTGKTTVIAALTELELRRNPDIVIEIAAPTGKAAELLSAGLAAALPRRKLQAQTLHRLFRSRPGTGKFGRNRENPLECDLLIVDECSMISLNSAANIFRGLRPETRVVLAGDHRQLEAIGSGAVLSELLADRGHESPEAALLAGAAVKLTENFRSKAAPIIQRLAREIRLEEKTPEELCRCVLESTGNDYTFIRQENGFSPAELLKAARARWGGLPETAAMTGPEAAAKAFELLRGFRVLSANRVGRGGCIELNREIAKALGLQEEYAPGTVLMVTENAADMGLSNGDTGVVFSDGRGGVRVRFEHMERSFALHELPPHECAFAMTVHKAQGSGFGEVFFQLPEPGTPLLSRELFYTGLTRAAKKITIAGSQAAVLAALSSGSSRTTFLAERILGLLRTES